MTRDVAVVTPWYPSAQRPFRGAFVRAMVEATAPATVYHTEVWGASLSSDVDAEVTSAYRALLPSATLSSRTVAGADLVTVPVPMPRGRPFAEQAHRSALALEWALGGAPIPAPVVHAHVGLLGGLPALRRKRADARLFVTEHATFLDRMLAEPDGHAGYAEVLAACEAFFVVGDPVRAQLADGFPRYAHKLRPIANPIDFDAPRTAPVTALRRWLFVGALIERKGVRWLLEAFAVCRRDDPRLTLALVGDGELRSQLEKRAAELGVAEAVTFAGAVPPARALRMMHRYDLLVHPSRYETFGVVVVEALAAGLPVIVTRCGGPEQTLAGIEASAGELIEVEDGAGAIVAGYRRLRDRFPDGIDLAVARRALAERFGYPAVARMHHDAWFEEGHARPVSGARR
jgi:glycosyltransferase involved in cell wall biosynthesis